jgi:hypothetical protein
MRTLSFIDIKNIGSIGGHRRSSRTAYQVKIPSTSFNTRCLLFHSKNKADNTTKVLLSSVSRMIIRKLHLFLSSSSRLYRASDTGFLFRCEDLS